jgi:mevalonate kinase
MSALLRFFKVVSYDKLNQTADLLLAVNQETANEIRKNGINELATAMTSNNVEELKKVMQRHQDALDKLTTSDKSILEFLNKAKD